MMTFQMATRRRGGGSRQVHVWCIPPFDHHSFHVQHVPCWLSLVHMLLADHHGAGHPQQGLTGSVAATKVAAAVGGRRSRRRRGSQSTGSHMVMPKSPRSCLLQSLHV